MIKLKSPNGEEYTVNADSIDDTLLITGSDMRFLAHKNNIQTQVKHEPNRLALYITFLDAFPASVSFMFNLQDDLILAKELRKL